MDYEKAFSICKNKLENHLREIPADMPEFCAREDGRYFDNKSPKNFMDIGTWMPSFFTGEVLLAYEDSGEKRYLEWLEGFQGVYHEKVFSHAEDTMHDLGFLYTLYAVGLYRVTGRKEYRTIFLKAADELVKRFSLKGNYIRAWGRLNETESASAGEAIIDCMMNLPLLFAASEESGISLFREAAVRHADTTLHHFMRPDGSVYHTYHFDRETGQPLWGCNHCGYGDESFWARGCAWAVYGFVIAYIHTGFVRYLDASCRLADLFLRECADGDDCIPVWDFRLPASMPKEKDTSAAAIAASAFYELGQCTGDRKYTDACHLFLQTLSQDRYFNTDETIPGILRESNGLKHYTLFGDYFFMEALMKQLHPWKMYW